MAKFKRLTTEQLMAAAKHLAATDQLVELMACIALERNVGITEDIWADELAIEADTDYTKQDMLIEHAQSYAYEIWFHHESIGDDVEDMIETLASKYI